MIDLMAPVRWGRWVFVGGVVAALFQTIVLAGMIEGRASILRNGTEVVLETVPVDPRDLLRGRYVVLSYEISNIPASRFVLPDGDERFLPMRVYVVVAKSGLGTTFAQSVHFERPQPKDGEIILEGQLPSTYISSDFKSNRNIPVYYGIERFYLPEDEAPRLEEQYRSERTPIHVVVAVSDDGETQIKRLLVDGNSVYEEPFY